jgi:hypothetical protein
VRKVQQRLSLELDAERLGHRVALDRRLGRPQRPARMMDVAALDPLPAVEGVEAVALGQPARRTS